MNTNNEINFDDYNDHGTGQFGFFDHEGPTDFWNQWSPIEQNQRDASTIPPSSPPPNQCFGQFEENVNNQHNLLGAEESLHLWADQQARTEEASRRTLVGHNHRTLEGPGLRTNRGTQAVQSTTSLGYTLDSTSFDSPPPARRRSPSVAEREQLLRTPWQLHSANNHQRPVYNPPNRSHVDLTHTGPAMPPASASRVRKRSSAQSRAEPPPNKRPRLSPSGSRSNAIDIEEVDSADEGNAQILLDKERVDLVKTQQNKNGDEAPKRFGEMNCIICLDNFTNLTATACGHIFCHECLTQALIAGEKSSDRNSGTCPMCRKTLKRTTKGNIIPLSFMTKKEWQSSSKGHGQS